MIKVAILLTCHNRCQLTINCLTNVFQQIGLSSKFEVTVFLVDDGSTDNTSLEVKLHFPQVIVIQGNGKLYWNRGMYVAWKNAVDYFIQFDGYLWLNDDTYLVNDGLAIMINAAYETNFKSIICGSIHSPHDPTILTYGGCKIVNNSYSPNYPNNVLDIADLINGNCVFVPHYVYKNVGNLDWTYRHAIGDNEYSLRAKSKQIQSFSTGQFVGICSKKESLPKWCLPEVKLVNRLLNLYSPLGSAEPLIYFKYNLKYYGVSIAIKSIISTHVRVFFPKLWLKNQQ